MAIYRLSNTNSDRTGGADFSKALQETGFTTGTISVPVAANATETSFGFTPVGDPGTNGVTGTYVVSVNVTTGNNNGRLAISLSRINSAGTVQTTSTATAEQTASAGVKTYTLSTVNLGTWASGDRLRVNYVFRNVSTMTAITLAITAGGTTDTVDVPWTNAVNATATVTGQTATSSFGTINETGSAVEVLAGVEAASQFGTINEFGSAVEILTGIEATTQLGTINETASAATSISGLQVSSEVGFVNAEVITNGHANVSGEHIHSSFATITANGNGQTALAGDQSASQIEPLVASGQATASSGNTSADSTPGTSNATGAAVGGVGGLEATATASVDTDAHGTVVADGNGTATGSDLTPSAQPITAAGSAITLLNGQEVATQVGEATANGVIEVDAVVVIDSVEASAAAGSVTANGVSTSDATAVSNGIQASTATGLVTANGGQIQVSGGRFRPSQTYDMSQDAVAKVAGVRAKIKVGRVKAYGVNNAAAAVKATATKTKTGRVKASGIQNPTEEMLLLLLA